MVRRSWLSAVLVLAGMAVPASAQTKLEWKFKEGEKFFLEQVVNNKMAVKVMGMDMNMDTVQTQVTSFAVLKKNSDGSVVIEQKIESIKIEAEGPAAAFAQAGQQMEGASFKFTLSPKLQVTKFEGYEEFVKKLGGDDPMLGAMMRMMMSEETMKQSAAEPFAFLPDKPVSKGDKWERKQNLQMAFIGLTSENKYNYQGKDTLNGKPVEKIGVTSTVKFEPPKGDAGGLPFQISKADFKPEKSDGTFFFDASAGKLVSSEVKMKMKGTMGMSVAGQEIEMEMDVDTTTKTKLLDKKP